MTSWSVILVASRNVVTVWGEKISTYLFVGECDMAVRKWKEKDKEKERSREVKTQVRLVVKRFYEWKTDGIV